MYPDSAEELLEALTLGEANFDTYRADIGGTAEDKTEISQDRANLAQAIANQALAEADKQVVTQIKNAVYEGNTEDSVAAYPPFALVPLPFPEVKAGCLARFREKKARFKAAKGYTKEIGIAMGMEKASGGAISLDSLIAALKALDIGNYQYTVAFQKQGQSAMLVQYRLKGTEKWLEAKTALTSPVTIDLPASATEDGAVQIEIRGRLLKGNQQVGQWSPIYTLTVNP